MKNASKTQQLLFFVLPFILISAAFPFVVWPVLIKLTSSGGADSALVGEPSGIDPGAVWAVLIYAVCTGLFARWLFKRGHSFAVKCIGALGVVLGLLGFAIVSSLMWL